MKLPSWALPVAGAAVAGVGLVYVLLLWSAAEDVCSGPRYLCKEANHKSFFAPGPPSRPR